MSGSWTYGLLDCFNPISTCCLATWCPCILYGKTQARREGSSNASCCNGDCTGCCALSLCSLQGICQTISRKSIRRQYNIQSNGCIDCLASWCCGCCALVQEDKEVKAQQEGKGKHGAPEFQPSMMYAQPQDMNQGL